jgi:hypothetical protein
MLAKPRGYGKLILSIRSSTISIRGSAIKKSRFFDKAGLKSVYLRRGTIKFYLFFDSKSLFFEPTSLKF